MSSKRSQYEGNVPVNYTDSCHIKCEAGYMTLESSLLALYRRQAL